MRPLGGLPAPFLEARHAALRRRVAELAPEIEAVQQKFDVCSHGEGRIFLEDQATREFAQVLGRSGVLRAAVLGESRELCVAREEVAHASGFADCVLALQGLGSDPIRRAGSAELLRRYVEPAAEGSRIAAFALTEVGAGSDARAIETTARRDGDVYRLDGCKTLITNAGVADFYCVFARLQVGPAPADKDDVPTLALVVDASTPGLRVVERLRVLGPHPIGSIAFEDCRVPVAQGIGIEGEGLKIAFDTLRRFRPSVGAAALGLARRALEEALRHVSTRRQFGRELARFQMIKERLADAFVDLEHARLQVERAAWLADVQPDSEAVETTASMGKLVATEAAGRVADLAVQLFGGRGVVAGERVEAIFRDVRALRIYEGSSEVQKLILARYLTAGKD